jgi:hypothetical protein
MTISKQIAANSNTGIPKVDSLEQWSEEMKESYHLLLQGLPPYTYKTSGLKNEAPPNIN